MNVLAVFAMLLSCGALGSSLDIALSEDVASLLDKMKAQEILNQELTTKLLRLEEKLPQQANNGHNVVKRAEDATQELPDPVVTQLSQRVTQMGAELQALKAQTASDLQTLKTQTAAASTFVRWGSSHCGGSSSSSSSSLVYSGIMGGSWYQDTGAATNFLCLTLSPTLSHHTPPSFSYASLYGAEFQSLDSSNDKDPLCALCRAAFSTTVMVPGSDVCSPGWVLQYSGFLMAGFHGHAAGTEYICVDAAKETLPNSQASHDGKLLYHTVTRCGSLPCGPYVQNTVVTCAVCSM